jgi:hypothetical protein
MARDRRRRDEDDDEDDADDRPRRGRRREDDDRPRRGRRGEGGATAGRDGRRPGGCASALGAVLSLGCCAALLSCCAWGWRSLPRVPPDQASGPAATARQEARAAEPPGRTPPARPIDIRVTSLIVKRVDGRHRYFFQMHNADDRPFEGDIRITLHNGQRAAAVGGGETFSTKRPMDPGGRTTGYVEIRTGPVAVHGDYGIVRYKFEAVSGGAVVAAGEGPISDRYEDLSR